MSGRKKVNYRDEFRELKDRIQKGADKTASVSSFDEFVKEAAYTATSRYDALKKIYSEVSPDARDAWRAASKAATSSANRLGRAAKKYSEIAKQARKQEMHGAGSAFEHHVKSLQRAEKTRRIFSRYAEAHGDKVEKSLLKRDLERFKADKPLLRHMRKSLIKQTRD